MSVLVNRLGFVKDENEENDLKVEWERKQSYISITIAGLTVDLEIKDVGWLRDVLYQINSEINRKEEGWN